MTVDCQAVFTGYGIKRGEKEEKGRFTVLKKVLLGLVLVLVLLGANGYADVSTEEVRKFEQYVDMLVQIEESEIVENFDNLDFDFSELSWSERRKIKKHAKEVYMTVLLSSYLGANELGSERAKSQLIESINKRANSLEDPNFYMLDGLISLPDTVSTLDREYPEARLLETFLAVGMDPNFKRPDMPIGTLALAVIDLDFRQFELLIANGAQVVQAFPTDRNPLCFAMISGGIQKDTEQNYPKILGLMLQQPDVDVASYCNEEDKQDVPIHNVNTLWEYEKLLRAATPEQRKQFGEALRAYSPFFMHARDARLQPEMTERFLKFGLDPNARDPETQKTPLDILLENKDMENFQEKYDLLRKYGAKTSAELSQ